MVYGFCRDTVQPYLPCGAGKYVPFQDNAFVVSIFSAPL